MARITKINHIAIVVPDVDASLSFWRDGLGFQVDHIEEVPSQQAVVAFLPVGDSEVELVKPTSVDTGAAKFLREHGPGMHHLCFEVDSLNEMLSELKSKGIRLVNDEPVILPGRKIAFIHPKSAGGVLVELYELTE
jgi:methylmalonyl-CoA/ethylmalonyl-CoA epimerase